MSDPLDYTARLKAKGLDSTGVTEEIARNMANTLGSHTLLIVEVIHDEVTKHADGAQQVRLAATRVEPVPAEQEEVVREFMRALYRTRPDVAGMETLKGTVDGPSVPDAAAALSAHVEHDETGEVTGVWDGDTEGPLPDAPAREPHPGGALSDLDEPEEEDAAEQEPSDDGPWPGDADYQQPAATVVDFSGRKTK